LIQTYKTTFAMAEEQSSTDEIRDSSTSWTLASDDMLLRHMTAFGERLSKRADEVQAKLSALRDDTKRAEDTLGLLTNEFLYLANEQFIENRVYEDSDPEYAGAISEDGGMDGAGGDFAKSKEEEEAEFAAKAGVALRAGQQFLVDNFVKVKVSC
jgi:WASH complex subunit FAM21